MGRSKRSSVVISSAFSLFFFSCLLWPMSPVSFAESMEDQILMRKGQPIYLKNGKQVECEKFWWIIQAADFVQCDKGTMAQDVPVDEIDLDRTFGEGTAERCAGKIGIQGPVVQSSPSYSPSPVYGMTEKDTVTRSPEEEDKPPHHREPSGEWIQEMLHKLASPDKRTCGNALLDLFIKLSTARRGNYSEPLIPKCVELLSDETMMRYEITGLAIPPLYQRGNAPIGEIAQYVLTIIGPGAVEPLHRELRRTDSNNVKKRALLALSDIRDPRSYEIMMATFQKDDQWPHRSAAMSYFGNLKDSRALPVLHHALFHDEPRARVQAAAVLGRIGNRQSTPYLIKAMESSSDNLVRSRAASSLGSIGDPEAVEALVRARKDPRNKGVLGESVTQAVDGALYQTANESSVQALSKALRDKDEGNRLSAVKLMAGLKDPSAVPHLIQVLQSDRNEEIRSFAVRGLLGRNMPEVKDALISALQTDSSPIVRQAAVKELRFYNDPRVLEAVARAARQDLVPAVRNEAVGSLTVKDHNGIARAALEYVAQNDEDPKIRNYAKSVLSLLSMSN